MSHVVDVPGAKCVGGVWLPASEIHLTDMMLHDPKAKLIRDGKATYQIRKLDAAMEYVPANRRRVAVDVGAHVGLWSMWLTKFFQRVEAFEPVPLHRELFRLNVAGEYALHECALGEVAGMIEIEIPLETTGNAHVAIGRRHPGTKHVPHPDQHYTVQNVPLTPLDQFGFQDVDFLKIDVEGYELSVVKGAKGTLERCRPVIVIEQKGNESAYGHPRDAAVAWLDALGYRRERCLSGDWILRWPT